MLKQVCMKALVLAFTDYTQPFLLETDASKDRTRGSAVPEAGRQDDITLLPMAAEPSLPHEKNYHLTKLGVFGTGVGGDRTFQGVPALSTFPSKDRQSSIDLQ